MLKTIKVLHTVIWAAMAAAVVYVALCGIRGVETTLLWWAVWLIIAETVVLLLNKGRCPFTNMAEHYTKDSRPNFDIYLPGWIAKYNQAIFGSIFIFGLALVMARRLF